MKATYLLIISLTIYLIVLPPFTQYMQNRPYLTKIGYTPQPVILKFFATDQKTFLAACLILKVIFHSGHLLRLQRNDYVDETEQKNTYNQLKTATRLDPYNMDSYYLVQAMAWDEKNISEICKLHEYGMQYRNWDFYLPFFIGFNYSYFLKNYSKAASFYMKAQELTGSGLFGRLAGRYLYESGKTTLAITYLNTMAKSTRNQKIRESYNIRLRALQEVQRIEKAVIAYKSKKGSLPKTLDILLSEGFLLKPVIDPYGGTFYLDKNSKPRSTSKLSFAHKSN